MKIKIITINKIYLFIFYIFINFVNVSNALQITEIMYDLPGSDASREWFEVYNESNKEEDLSKYKFYYEGECKLKNINKDSGNNILKQGDYGVVVIGNDATLFKTDNPDFSGNLFFTGYSAGSSGILRNSTSTSLSVKDERNVGLCDPQVKYKYDFIGDSKSLGESFNIIYLNSTSTEVSIVDSYVPTPGKQSSKIKQSSTNIETVDEKADTIIYRSSYNPRAYTVGDIKLEVPKQVFGVAGGYTFFPARVINSKGDILKSDVIWSMGDGVELATSSPEYVYKNPGNYTAIIEALTSDRVYGIERVSVNVQNPDIIISEYKISDSFENTGYIKIRNNNNEEINIGNFVLGCGWERFKISKHLILKPKEEYYFYNNILNFKCLDNNQYYNDINNSQQKYIALFFPNNKLLTEYKQDLLNKESSKYSKEVKNNSLAINLITEPQSYIKKDQNIKLTDLKVATNVKIKEINNTQENNEIKKEESVDKPKTFIEKLLYFLYE